MFEFSGLGMTMHKYARGGEFSIFSVTLYPRDLLIVNLWCSAQVCVVQWLSQVSSESYQCVIDNSSISIQKQNLQFFR